MYPYRKRIDCNWTPVTEDCLCTVYVLYKIVLKQLQTKHGYFRAVLKYMYMCVYCTGGTQQLQVINDLEGDPSVVYLQGEGAPVLSVHTDHTTIAHF